MNGGINSRASWSAADVVRLAALGAAAFLLYSFRLEHTPRYLHDAEILFGLQAHAIATTGRDVSGRLLPLYFQMQPIGDNVWFHPMLVYVTALFLQILPFAEWSVRLPSAAVGAVDVMLMYVLAKRIFGRDRDATLASGLLMLTPAHFIHSRIAMDYIYPVPFVMGWMIALLVFLERRRLWILFAATSLLGIGVYTYIASVIMMPLYLVFTLAALWWTATLTARAALVALAGFAWPLAAIPFWLAYHPVVVAETLSRYQPDAAPRISGPARRLSAYWGFHDPTYLFVTGGYASPINSTRHAGVFSLPLIAPMAAGVWSAARQRSLAGLLAVVGFFTAPLAACIAVPEPYAIDRELTLLPFGILLAVYGLHALAASTHPAWRRAATVVLALVPLHFAFVCYDYFTDYRRVSAIWFELNHRGAFEKIVELAPSQSDGGARIYLPVDKDQYMDSYWQFTLTKLHRRDLHDRTVLYESSELEAGSIPSGSLVLMRRGDSRIEALVQSGQLRVLSVIEELADPPEFIVLERP